MILPPLYYGMHRFQTLLRKRQQTLCLRSFLNDAVTACDPQKKKKLKEKPKGTEKLGSTVRRNASSGFLGGCEGGGKDVGLPVSLRVASMNTQA